jgi:polar amino acid transport system substrate-binding protein
MLRRQLLTASLTFAAIADASAAALRTAAQAGIPLKYNLSGTGAPGFCVDYIRALQRADKGLQFQGLDETQPLLRIESDLANDRLDLFFGLLKTRERAERVRFVDSPSLYAIRHQVAVRADDKVQIRSLDDIRALGANGTLLTTRGTAYISFLAEQGGLLVDAGATDNAQNLRKLLSGRGRFFYQADFTLRHTIEAEALQSQVRILPAVFHQDVQLLAYSPALPAERLARVVAAMKAIEASGEAGRLRQAYDLS